MRATDNLRKDHDLILSAVRLLDYFCATLESGGAIPVEHLQTMIHFIRYYIDGCHHQKEEQALFPALVRRGVPKEFGPVGVMLHEHETSRDYIRNMNEAITQIKAGQPDAAQRFTTQARWYIALLSDHILKENNVLFYMANQVLSSEEDQALLKDFARIEKESNGGLTPQELLDSLEIIRAAYQIPVHS